MLISICAPWRDRGTDVELTVIEECALAVVQRLTDLNAVEQL